MNDFQLRKFKSGNEINALKKIMDLWLVEIIRDLDFSPRRFGQCPRCGGFFYSPTAKERVYCSTRCGGAARQEKFREERRAEDH
jgi:ribosomal protein S27AE